MVSDEPMAPHTICGGGQIDGCDFASWPAVAFNPRPGASPALPGFGVPSRDDLGDETTKRGVDQEERNQ